ncbi:MAG: DoxX family membrane protein [Verrucomicrobiales bacterium]|nr:DoxX family membrane protein [Verrucomicrobiales bacterium]
MIKKLPVWLENRVDPIELLFRIIVGGIFFYAGFLKINDLQSFELSIRNYQILNDPWVGILAMTLPPLEIILGISILIKFLYQGSLLIACMTMSVFIASLISLLARNIDINCGCLGLNTSVQIQIMIDILIVLMCIFLMKYSKRITRNVSC